LRRERATTMGVRRWRPTISTVVTASCSRSCAPPAPRTRSLPRCPSLAAAQLHAGALILITRLVCCRVTRVQPNIPVYTLTGSPLSEQVRNDTLWNMGRCALRSRASPIDRLSRRLRVCDQLCGGDGALCRSAPARRAGLQRSRLALPPSELSRWGRRLQLPLPSASRTLTKQTAAADEVFRGYRRSTRVAAIDSHVRGLPPSQPG
jgi:hypothetical protein